MPCTAAPVPSMTWLKTWNQERGWASSYQTHLLPHNHHHHYHCLPPLHHHRCNQVMHLVLGFIFPLAPLFLLRGQAREKSGIEVDCKMMMMVMMMMIMRRMMTILKRAALLATSARSFAALDVLIFSNTRRWNHQQFIIACIVNIARVTWSLVCLQVNPQKSLVCGESTVE